MNIDIYWNFESDEGMTERITKSIPIESALVHLKRMFGCGKEIGKCRIVNSDNGHEFSWENGSGWRETKTPRKGITVNFNGMKTHKPGAYGIVSGDVDQEQVDKMRAEWAKMQDAGIKVFKTPIIQGVKAKIMIDGKEVAMASDVEWTRELKAEPIEMKKMPVTIKVKMVGGGK